MLAAILVVLVLACRLHRDADRSRSAARRAESSARTEVSTGSAAAGDTGADAGARPTAPTPTEAPLPGGAPTRCSLPALMREAPSGGKPRVLRTEVETADYTRYQVTYRSDELTVSGVLLRPKGPGPFPGIVLNHGYIEPSIYVTGQGLAREQDALARAGFVVLHTDYRGHAASDPVDRDSTARPGSATPATRSTRSTR